MAAPQEDNYAYEEEQERKALLQGLHGPMKQWYNGGEAARCVLRIASSIPPCR